MGYVFLKKTVEQDLKITDIPNPFTISHDYSFNEQDFPFESLQMKEYLSHKWIVFVELQGVENKFFEQYLQKDEAFEEAKKEEKAKHQEVVKNKNKIIKEQTKQEKIKKDKEIAEKKKMEEERENSKIIIDTDKVTELIKFDD